MYKRIVCFVLLLISFQKITAQENSMGYDKPTYIVDDEKKLHINLILKAAKNIKLQGPDFLAHSDYTVSKDSLGHWEVITPPMPIGFHYFWIEADGKKYLLPNQETYFGYNQEVNGFEVNSNESFFEAKTNQKGIIEKRKIDDNLQEYFLYKPFGFSSEKKYPLLVLFHGAGENASGWIKQGKIQNVLDNLIAEKKVKPLLVLMLNGDIKNQKSYADLEEETLLELPIVEKQLINQILPDLQKEFRISDKSIAGLSKGSFQAFKIGTDHPDIFANVGMFSPVLYSGVLEDGFAKIKTKNFKKQSYFLSVGTLESDRFINFKNILEKEFRKKNVKYRSYLSPQTYHEWLTWRRSLYYFLLWENGKY